MAQGIVAKAPIFFRENKYTLSAVVTSVILVIIFGCCYSKVAEFREILATHKDASTAIGVVLSVILGAIGGAAVYLDGRKGRTQQSQIPANSEPTPQPDVVSSSAQETPPPVVEEKLPSPWKMQDYLRAIYPLPVLTEFRKAMGGWIRGGGDESQSPQLVQGINDIDFLDQVIMKADADVTHAAVQGIDAKGKRFIAIHSHAVWCTIFIERAPGTWTYSTHHPSEIDCAVAEFIPEVDGDKSSSEEEKYNL